MIELILEVSVQVVYLYTVCLTMKCQMKYPTFVLFNIDPGTHNLSLAVFILALEVEEIKKKKN